jgi:hypothetical protein
LSLLASLALLAWKASVDRQLEAGWRQSLGGASFLERYPATHDNATVRDLETLGAAIGIDLASAHTRGHVYPTPDAAKRFQAIMGSLINFQRENGGPTEASLAPPPPELAAFLDSVRPGLDAIRKRLAQGPPPVWKRDLGAGFEGEIPNYAPMLQRVLLLDAHEQLRAGRETQAGEILETSWRLNQAVAHNSPSLITQLMAQTMIRLQQPILRSFFRAPAGWRARLLRLDQQSRILLALQCQAFFVHLSSRDRPIKGSKWYNSTAFPLWEPWDHARRLSAIVEELPRRDLRSFDPEAFAREQQAKIPNWQYLAPTLLPDLIELWPRSAHVELEAELTALVLEERERLAAGGPPRPTDRRPSRVNGLSWIYEDIPGGTTLHLDGELRSQEAKPVPLRFIVRRVAGSGARPMPTNMVTG